MLVAGRWRLLAAHTATTLTDQGMGFGSETGRSLAGTE